MVIKITEGCLDALAATQVFLVGCFPCLVFRNGKDKRLGKRLSTETVEGTSLSLEGVDDVECGDGLSLGVLGVGDGITDDVLEEDLENSTGLFVDQKYV